MGQEVGDEDGGSDKEGDEESQEEAPALGLLGQAQVDALQIDPSNAVLHLKLRASLGWKTMGSCGAK